MEQLQNDVISEAKDRNIVVEAPIEDINQYNNQEPSGKDYSDLSINLLKY